LSGTQNTSKIITKKDFSDLKGKHILLVNAILSGLLLCTTYNIPCASSSSIV